MDADHKVHRGSSSHFPKTAEGTETDFVRPHMRWIPSRKTWVPGCRSWQEHVRFGGQEGTGGAWDWDCDHGHRCKWNPIDSRDWLAAIR